MKISRAFSTLALLGALFALAGCPDVDKDKPSSGGSSADLSHVYVVLDAPKAAVALQEHAQARSTESINTSGSTGATPQAVTVSGCINGTGLGTILAVNVDSYTIISCGGIYMTVGIAPTANDTSVVFGPTGAYQVWWDVPNCDKNGHAYTRAAPGLSGGGLVQGMAFWMDVQLTGAHDGTTEWMVVPGGTTTDNVTVQSFFDGNSCQSTSAVLSGLYAVVPYDEAVVQWPATPVAGPVLITHL